MILLRIIPYTIQMLSTQHPIANTFLGVWGFVVSTGTYVRMTHKNPPYSFPKTDESKAEIFLVVLNSLLMISSESDFITDPALR